MRRHKFIILACLSVFLYQMGGLFIKPVEMAFVIMGSSLLGYIAQTADNFANVHKDRKQDTQDHDQST